MAIQVWDIFDRRRILLTVLAAIAWGVGVSIVVYSNYRYIKAAKEAESRQAKIDNQSAQCIAELQSTNKKHVTQISELENRILDLTSRTALHQATVNQIANERNTAVDDAATARKEIAAERARSASTALHCKAEMERNGLVFDNLDGIADKRFHLIRNNCPQNWAQRIALKRILTRESVDTADLTTELTRCGFADVGPLIVEPLVNNRVLLNSDGKMVWIQDSEVRRVLEHFFRETPLC